MGNALGKGSLKNAQLAVIAISDFTVTRECANMRKKKEIIVILNLLVGIKHFANFNPIKQESVNPT